MYVINSVYNIHNMQHIYGEEGVTSASFSRQVGVILNLTPDHLERHGSMEAYGEHKCRMFAKMEPRDLALIPQGQHNSHLVWTDHCVK